MAPSKQTDKPTGKQPETNQQPVPASESQQESFGKRIDEKKKRREQENIKKQ